MDKAVSRVQAATIDGRSRTPRFIQKQLTVLHDALASSATSIQQAITRDTGCSSAEAWFEVHMTLKAVKQHFGSINFKGFLEQEYSLAQGKDNVGRRVAYGCAYIIPAQHTRFYSIIGPAAAAIAAGNCVVIELQQTLLEVESLLRKLLVATMDKDTFAIVDQRLTDKFFTEQVVVANSGESASFSSSRILSSRGRRTVAVVDRSAVIADAAKHIVRSRFRFGGKSPYAPDVVLVNEFALKEFCQAAARHLTDEISESVTANGHSKPQQLGSGSGLQKDLQQASSTTLISGSRGSIYLLKQHSESILSRKIDEPALIIVSTSSLDDAIDTANTTGCLLATYFFADPAATKYLSQFIPSNVSFANHIPSQLIVGPSAPQDFPISLDTRYTKDMFSTPSPEYITVTAEETARTAFLDMTPSKQVLEKLKAEIQAALAPMGEPMTTTIGFFEQGIMTGMGIEATLLFSALGTCAWYTVPWVMRKVRG